MEYTTLYKSESFGMDDGFGIKIEVAATNELPDLKSWDIRTATDKAQKMISDEIQAAIKAENPKTAQVIEENKKLTQLFPDPIYIEEIPNGYCSDWCCRQIPWFIVTTVVGRIKIGWRKRVISIDWSSTRDTKNCDELFINEDVTKGFKFIHAWSLDDAKRYIETILKNTTRG